MKLFTQRPISKDLFKPIQRVDGPMGRKYQTPDGHFYDSVTSFISKTNPKKDDGILAWKKRIGFAEAAKISKYSLDFGTKMHAMMEARVVNSDEWLLDDSDEVLIQTTKNLEQTIEPHLDNILMSECQLYSDKMRLAGTTDLLATWDGVLSIIDFKNSREPKKLEWINDYFLQGTVYARMVEEACDKTKLSIKVPQVVIVIGCHTGETQVFKVNSEKYMDELNTRLELFYK